MLRSSLDIDGYAGSKLNQLDFTSVAETSERFSWIFIDLITTGPPISMERHCISSKKEIKKLR